MPIRKFHSVAEMTPLPDRQPFDPENLRIALELSRTCRTLARLTRVAGVWKFRSYDELKLASSK